MRKIIAGLFMSVDGVAESPEKWTFEHFNDEVGAAVQASMDACDTMLLGRKTYQQFAAYWPDAQEPIADYMNNTPKVVVSTTLEKPTWGATTVIGTNVADELRTLKQRPGGNIGITGSIGLVRSLLRENVIDEPADRPYGVEAVMRDNSGNWLVLVEPKEFTPSDFA